MNIITILQSQFIFLYKAVGSEVTVLEYLDGFSQSGAVLLKVSVSASS